MVQDAGRISARASPLVAALQKVLGHEMVKKLPASNTKHASQLLDKLTKMRINSQDVMTGAGIRYGDAGSHDVDGDNGHGDGDNGHGHQPPNGDDGDCDGDGGSGSPWR